MVKTETIHIHKVCQILKCSYETAIIKYGKFFDYKFMISVDKLKNVQNN